MIIISLLVLWFMGVMILSMDGMLNDYSALPPQNNNVIHFYC